MAKSKDPKAVGVEATPYATDTSDAVIREVQAVTNDAILRNLVFAGVRTKQLVIEDGAVELADEASAPFLGQVAAAVGDSIVLTPGITRRELKNSAALESTFLPSVSELLRELEAATAAIDQKQAQVGAFLGNPVTDVEFGGKDYEIPYRKYEHGAIYVTPHGTREVHGAIYHKYVGLGAEAGFLGFPETDELDTTLGTGKLNHFQGGSIYWSLPTGAWSIRGPLRNKWWQMDGERGYLGFPVSDVEQISSGSVSYFQHGSLVLSADGNFHDYPHSVAFTTKLEGGSVKCSTDFGMNSRGEWYFRGHLHNDDAVGTLTTVATSPKFVAADGRAFAVTAERSLGGTFDLEDRNDDWDQVGSDDFIRDNWDILRSAGIRTVMKSRTTVGDILAVLIPVLAVLTIFGAASTQKWCGPVASQSRDPFTGETQNRLEWQLSDPNQPCPPGY